VCVLYTYIYIYIYICIYIIEYQLQLLFLQITHPVHSFATKSTKYPLQASFTEPMGVRRSLAAGLPGVPSLPGRAGRAVTLGDFAAEMVEVDLTSRLSSKDAKLS
jgi:hypothetical protein